MRVMRIVLLLSLALNLAVVGLVAGAALSGKRFAPPRYDLSLGPIGAALSEEDRRAIGARLRDQPGLPSGPRARRRMMEEMLAVLRSDPFDPAPLAEAMAQHRARSAAVLEAGQAALLERLAAMSPAERAALADRLEAGARRPGRSRDGG
ncbi:hypothetical protein OG2516_15209 [Oceanicola granulosus HTCC2516]|uniref:Periplasmic heavy metal sensor n=1 Tax=Oceanicola granulosus (strain ATCC BAA-861 / DSM 15982 / KCTC 12143 / HTCC2516) TaxID=314256 RepID=Q2C9S3_OCEGH|nr:periplasmic heavy metal sensor [Oceanicola granulosus]EAR49427.1 hypothetical protein OG2516_15209 [Oceanicola granulosus HTCC2516]